MRMLAWLGIGLSLSGCGGGLTVADPGRGSGTLTIDARAEVDNNAANAKDAAQFDASLVVRLTKGTLPVLGATVEMDTSLGKITLSPKGDPGRYEATQAGYATTYTLSARAGDDYVEDVALSGPAAHAFSSPELAAQVVYGEPLEVKWSPSGATEARLEGRELDRISIPDDGSYTIPGTSLRKPDGGKAEDERITVERSESIVPAGAINGSRFTVSIRNELTLLVVSK